MATASQVSIGAATDAAPRLSRPHLSTLVVAALVAAFFVVMNVPGSRTTGGPFFHGWPYLFGQSYEYAPTTVSNGPQIGTFRLTFPATFVVPPPASPLDERWNWALRVDDLQPHHLTLDVLIALAIVALAAVLWERRRRKLPHAWSFRFSELLTLIVLAALACGWWVSWQTQARRHQHALRELAVRTIPPGARALLPRMSVETLAAPRWLTHLIGASRLPSMFTVPRQLHLYIQNPRDQDEMHAALRNLPTVTSLTLAGRGVDERWLATAAELPELEDLHLYDTSLTLAAIESLRSAPRLRHLEVFATSILQDPAAPGAPPRWVDFKPEHLERLRRALPHVHVVGPTP